MEIKFQVQGLRFHLDVAGPINHVARELLFEPEPTLPKEAPRLRMNRI